MAKQPHEIEASPELPNPLLLNNCILTIDAMGDQTPIAVKNNQAGLAAATDP
jgi:predicted transposase YbfD/YdcC